MGRLFVFMGKSASGKDTLYGELLARYPEIHAVLSLIHISEPTRP